MSISSGSAQLPKRPIQVLAIKPNQTHVVRFLGDYGGCMMHHLGKQGYWPCQGASCPIAIHRHKVVWKGFGPAEEFIKPLGAWYQCVIEVTEALDEVLREFALRGQQWLLSHPQLTDKTTPVLGMFLEESNPDEVRPAFDVLPILSRIYRGATIVLGACNPVPPKMLSEAYVGGGPRILEEAKKELPGPATEEQWARAKKVLGHDPRDPRDAQPKGSRPLNGRGERHG